MENQQAFQELALAFGGRPALKPHHLSKIMEYHGGDGRESAAFILSCGDMDPEELLKNLSSKESDEKGDSSGQEEESTEEEEVASAEEAGVSAAAAKARPDAQAGNQTDDEELKSRLKRTNMGRSQRRVTRNSLRKNSITGNETTNPDDQPPKTLLSAHPSLLAPQTREVSGRNTTGRCEPSPVSNITALKNQTRELFVKSPTRRCEPPPVSNSTAMENTVEVSKPTQPAICGGSSSTIMSIDRPGAHSMWGSNIHVRASDAARRYDSQFDMHAGDVPVLTATLVHEESSKSLVVESRPNENEKKFWRDRRCWLFAIGLVVVAVGVAAGLVMSKGGDDVNEQVVSQQYDELLDLLSANSPDGGTSLFDPASVQFKAFAWLHKDPSLESYSDSQKLTRYVLATFFTAAGGSDWMNSEGWLDYAESECNWYGVQCQNVVDGSVTELKLASNNVDGQLVKELSLLSDLEELQLFGNKLAGFVPNELGLLSKLKWLFLDGNDFIGIMPSEICDLKAEDTGALSRLEADCPEEMVCSCCTRCCSDDIGCVDM